MAHSINRRFFVAATAGVALANGPSLVLGNQTQEPDAKKDDKKQKAEERKPTEAEFERDYPAPSFKPKWARPQVNREMVQDFVIYAHSDFEMVKKLLDKEPGLLNASMDWGNGDWETGLGGASHMGRKDIAKYLLGKGARNDIFCAAMMGMLDVVKALITLEPNMIDSRGPHGFFNLHIHAAIGGKDARPVLDYLQSIKEVKIPPRFMK